MERRTVVITGASSGIGKAAALHLAALGWTVYGGVRKQEDADALEREATGDLVPVFLDVTNDTQILGSSGRIAQDVGERGLDGLVNNAGVSVYGPLEYLSVDQLRFQLEVNVIAQVAVTQAFLPLLRKATGRIVFVGSSAGRAPSLPFFGPYTASKYALEAIAESLRLELLPFGMKVSMIEPGSVESAIWDKGLSEFDGQIEALPAEGRERYESPMRRGQKLAIDTQGRAIPAQKVAVKIEHALTATRPLNNYLVGADARARAYLEAQVPKPLRDAVVSRMLGYRDLSDEGGDE